MQRMKFTLLETNMAPENQWDWKMKFLFGAINQLIFKECFKGDFQGV